MNGGGGNDVCLSTWDPDGDDTVVGGPGVDIHFVDGGDRSFTVERSIAGDDTLRGGPGRDCLAGKDGDGLDSLFGGDGRDRYGRDPGDTVSDVEVNAGFCIGE